ncbi:hypothetical protein DY000_02039331 [Brassica cretica]|uniref:FBD domain-containing protein n=1 Tax=Brassica cretica TaxID=69181 RepID=A0ABQ7B4X1_BRACR|nr:hypothetical protein DY000_02039331 [Brassica cretica]
MKMEMHVSGYCCILSLCPETTISKWDQRALPVHEHLGGEVALHRLQIPKKTVVSVEISAVNRSGLEGELSCLFFEYFRTLEVVRETTKEMNRSFYLI